MIGWYCLHDGLSPVLIFFLVILSQAVGSGRSAKEVRMHAHDYFVNLQMVTQVGGGVADVLFFGSHIGFRVSDNSLSGHIIGASLGSRIPGDIRCAPLGKNNGLM